MKISKKIRTFMYGFSAVSTIALPVSVVVSCGKTSTKQATKNDVKASNSASIVIDEKSTHDEVKAATEQILQGQADEYTLDGQKYDISGDKYTENIKPLVSFIHDNFPTIASPKDATIKDIPLYKLSEMDAFKNLTQSINPNSRFEKVEMPQLPDGYYWEYSSDQLYKHANPDGTKTTYWVKSISNFLVPNATENGTTFTFKVRVASEYGLRVLPNQVQEQEITIKINFGDNYLSDLTLGKYNDLYDKVAKNSPAKFFELHGWETDSATFNDLPQSMKDEAAKIVIPTKVSKNDLNEKNAHAYIDELSKLDVLEAAWNKSMLAPYIHTEYMPTVSFSGTAQEIISKAKDLIEKLPSKTNWDGTRISLEFGSQITDEKFRTILVEKILGVKHEDVSKQTNKWKDAFALLIMDHTHDDGVAAPKFLYYGWQDIVMRANNISIPFAITFGDESDNANWVINL